MGALCRSVAGESWLVFLSMVLMGMSVVEACGAQTTDVTPPITGPDAFEPDNAPDLSSWAAVEPEPVTLKEEEKGKPKPAVHNFHVEQDEDWHRFFVAAGQTVTVETRRPRSQADTFLTLYQLVSPNDPKPPASAEGCGDSMVINMWGEELVPVACNDDKKDSIASRVVYKALTSGVFYARVTLSPKALAAKAGDTFNAAETSYEFTTTSSYLFATSLMCIVLDADTLLPVPDAHVSLSPFGIVGNTAIDGIFVIPRLPAGQYTVTVSAQRYAQSVETVAVSGLLALSLKVALNRAEGSGSEAGIVELPSETRHARFDFQAPYGEVSLEEVLRVVQLYNAGHYHCRSDSEDAYGPYSGPVQCVPHPLDLVTQDWIIDLSELLRMIQFFGLGGYAYMANSEDGLCGVEK